MELYSRFDLQVDERPQLELVQVKPQDSRSRSASVSQVLAHIKAEPPGCSLALKLAVQVLKVLEPPPHRTHSEMDPDRDQDRVQDRVQDRDQDTDSC